ncbi:hypothetical protein GX830_02130 [Candidatus Dojkabacteria bacterium]|nr:hypothetical protein [Candidatus Dojkabacteria bacterium]
MNTEEVKEIYDYARIEDKLGLYHNVWLKDGYKTEYTFVDGRKFSSPFQMIDEELNSEIDEDRFAADLFESTLLRSADGYRYGQRLARRDKERYEEFLLKNSRDDFWATHQGIEVLTEYAISEERVGEEFVSAKLMKHRINYCYNLFLPEREPNHYSEKLYKTKEFIDLYLSRHLYEHLPFWKKEANARDLYKHFKAGGLNSFEVIKSVHQSYSNVEEHGFKLENPYVYNPHINKEDFKKFQNVWNLLEMPRMVDSKYKEFREDLIRKQDDPKFYEEIQTMFSNKAKKYPFLNIVERLGQQSKEGDTVLGEASKKFLSNLIVDPELYHIANSLRMYGIGNSKREKVDEEESMTYKRLLDMTFENPKFLDWQWYRESGQKTLREIYRYAPSMYLDIVSKYLENFVENPSLSPKQLDSIKKILYSIFTENIKEKNLNLYDSYSNIKNSTGDSKSERVRKLICGEFKEDLVLEENLKFFESTEKWVKFFKDRDTMFNVFSKLYLQDENLFLHIMESLIKNSSSTKDANYFDNVRIVNLLGKRLAEQVAKSIKTLKDPLMEEREEIERKIIMDAKKVCTPPEIRMTLNKKYLDPSSRSDLLKKYLENYSYFVESLDLKDLLIFNSVDGVKISGSGIDDKLETAVKALGYKVERNGNELNLNDFEYHEYLKRLVGIMYSPTLYEWREDDKANNKENDKLRSLFFVPQNIGLVFSDNKDGFSVDQTRFFLQNYLPWYIEMRLLTGNVDSLNRIISAWLVNRPDIKVDANNQKSDIEKRIRNIWPDTLEAFKVSYNYERFRRVEMLKKFLEATNVEEVVEMINNDPIKLAILSSSILSSSLNIAKEETVYKGIRKAIATLDKQFEGLSSEAYMNKERIDRVKSGLKKLGYEETEEGLEMFRTLWKNLWYLRGNRGLGQTITITAGGLDISNPNKSMYAKIPVSTSNIKGELVKTYVKQYDGGADHEFISWKQIMSIGEAEFDYIPVKDFLIKVTTNFATIFKKRKPDVVKEFEKAGPANILLKLPGRDEPLCEIFAVPRPQEAWKLIKDFAKLMTSEEGAEDAIELLKILNEN